MEKEKEAKEPTDVIILNRMYAGEYLGENLGHEVINLIKPDESDKCNSYLVYITNDGKINDNFHNGKWKASCVLYTRWCTREYKDKNKDNKTITLSMQEILAKTEGELVNLIAAYKNNKKNKEYTKIHLKSLEKYTYAGKGLEEIFSNNKHVTQPILYATFEVDKIIKVKPGYRVFIIDDKETWEKCRKINNNNEEKNKEEFIYINEGAKEDEIEYRDDKNGNPKKIITKQYNIKFAKQSLKQYITNGDRDNNKHFEKVYDNIDKVIKDDKYWDKDNKNPVRTYKELQDANLIVSSGKKNNFIGIIKQEYDELTYTNLFFHIFKSSPKLFCKFADEVLNIKSLSPNKIRFVREEGNIDLLIDDMENKTLIVIENKIKSGINGVRHDEAGEEVGNQLSKYIHYTFGYIVDKVSNKNGYTYKRLKSEIDDNDEERESNGYENYENRHFFIFAPKYKNFDKESINNNVQIYLNEAKDKYDNKPLLTNEQIEKSKYEIITYDKIYKYFSEYNFTKEDKKPSYYDEFLYAIERHSHDTDDIQERQMYERFAQRIEELTPKEDKK